MQIRYRNGTGSEYTPQTLAQKAVEQCSPTFDIQNEAIGIGIYSDSVFVDIRDTFELWVEKNDLLPMPVPGWKCTLGSLLPLPL
jgi:hypothetical protein